MLHSFRYWFTNCTHCPGTLHENWPDSAAPSGTTAGSLNHIMFGGGIGAWLYDDEHLYNIQCVARNMYTEK